MIITSRNVKHLNLGKEIDKTTLRMVHLKRVMELSQRAFRSAMEVFGSYHRIDSKGRAAKVEGPELDHVVQTKHMLDNLNQAAEVASGEFDRNVEALGKLEATLSRLERIAKKQAEDKKKQEMKAARLAEQAGKSLVPVLETKPTPPVQTPVKPVPAPVVVAKPKPN